MQPIHSKSGNFIVGRKYDKLSGLWLDEIFHWGKKVEKIKNKMPKIIEALASLKK